MKYIGNKTRLLDFIYESMQQSGIPNHGVFTDIFGGTGSVGRFFKNKGFKIISNDIMTYSYIYQYAYVKLNKMPKFSKLSKTGINGVIELLNELKPKKGYFYDNYAPSGKHRRQYFSDSNAMIVDAMRDKIQEWYDNKKLSKEEFYVILSVLIDAADFVANISGTYGAYLKIWRSMALKPLTLRINEIYDNKLDNEIYFTDSNKLVKNIKSDVIYIDPPYNERQYAPNFHVLESLAVWDKQDLKGKTGQRDYSDKKSSYCLRNKATDSFANLIENINSKYIIISYNNEGIIDKNDMLKILKNKGKVTEYTTKYRRFRTESDNEHRQYKKCDDQVIEHLYIVKANKH